MDIKRLILRIKNGDEQALEVLIKEMYPQVYTFLYRKMNQSDKAKDITQEVFIKFVENIDNYHEEDKLRNYLFKIGIHLANNYYKSLKYIDDQELDESKLIDEKNPHEIIMKKTKKDMMMQYVQKLNTISREIVILRYYHDLKFKDIAHILNIPESTAKSRHRQALMKLEELMKANYMKIKY